MRRDKEDQGGDFEVERPIHSNPDDPWFDWFLWLGVRILSAAGAYKSTYICGDENDGLHSVRYDSKVNIFLMSTVSFYLFMYIFLSHLAVGSRLCMLVKQDAHRHGR